MKNKITLYARSLGLTHWGTAKITETKTALVFLFPYYNHSSGRISLYARGADYHMVTKKYLLEICSFIFSETGMDFSQYIYCDISPYNDRKLAFDAGLGFYGKNGMLINEDLGSYFFIGYIITEGLSISLDSPLKTHCQECGKCIKACPGNALGNDFSVQMCASHISQQKGELLPFQEQILLKSGNIWGCDICQRVCPHNQILKETPLAEFRENLITDFCEEDLSALSEKEFRRKYQDRAFTWRGKKVLQRNIDITKKASD